MCLHTGTHSSQPVPVTKGKNFTFLQPKPLEEGTCDDNYFAFAQPETWSQSRGEPSPYIPSEQQLSVGAILLPREHLGNQWGHFYCHNI